MEGKYYTSERNIQILISLLKANGIKKVVASPGATNVTFVASVQQDSFFEIYSSVDERSAAYIACGLSAQSNEPVVLSCTGATASRNYFPGLTEAFYRKLPILAVTSTQDEMRIGHLRPQVIDRSNPPKDTVILSEHIRTIYKEDDEWDVNIRINRAVLELRHRGGGPVHINLSTSYSRDFSVKELPPTRVINRYTQNERLPELPNKGRIGIFIGNHKTFTKKETEAIEHFCATNDAVVFCDHTSGYYGDYRVQFAFVLSQSSYMCKLRDLNLLIHLGEVSGDTPSLGLAPKTVWRVSEDGELRDTFRKLHYVFEMPEDVFFDYYSDATCEPRREFFDLCQDEIVNARKQIPELPFSNTWIAQQTACRIPERSVLHLGILNSLRNWNLFEVSDTVVRCSNTGGFGIDGVLSTLIGASLADMQRLFFAVLGDLAFFYDMNVLGNRHVGNNVRILVVNNGKGTEFRNFNHPAAAFGDEADLFMAAGGHFGNKSRSLIKHYAEDLGFEYFSAENKKEFMDMLDRFLNPVIGEKPILFEVFTANEDESNALRTIYGTLSNATGSAKKVVRGLFGQKGVETIKKILR